MRAKLRYQGTGGIGMKVCPGKGSCVFLLLAAGAVAVSGLGDSPSMRRPSTVSMAVPHASGAILNALLVPALDDDALPLRWRDPRTALRCGPDTTVRVNGEPLVAGALVP